MAEPLVVDNTLLSIPSRLRHGDAPKSRKRAAEYYIWANIVQRCTNPNNHRYRWYGARGIKICSRWRDDYAAFLFDVGRRPNASATLGRIDNSRGYEPGNVRWESWTDQQNNRRDNHTIVFQGVTHTLNEWARITGIKRSTIWKRLRIGWSPEDTLTTPIRVWGEE